jgi:hypothetical protein
MDLTPSQPVTPGDEPPGEPYAQNVEAAPAADSGSRPQSSPRARSRSHPRAHRQPRQAEPSPHDEGTASRSSKEIGGKKFRVGTEDDYVPFRSRTKRRRRRMIMAGAAGLVLVGAGAYGVGSLIGAPSQASAAGSCSAKANDAAAADAALADAQTVTVSVAGQLPAAAQIKLNVYNSTNRRGLAAAAATVLKQRGFAVGKVTNDPLKANLTGAAEVRGASANALAMRVVAAEVIGSALRADGRTDGTVDLVLGAGFTALASPDQVSATLKQAQQAAHAPQSQVTPPKTASKCS